MVLFKGLFSFGWGKSFFLLFSLPSTVQLISFILHFTGETIILILFGLSTAQRILLVVLISLNIYQVIMLNLSATFIQLNLF